MTKLIALLIVICIFLGSILFMNISYYVPPPHLSKISLTPFTKNYGQEVEMFKYNLMVDVDTPISRKRRAIIEKAYNDIGLKLNYFKGNIYRDYKKNPSKYPIDQKSIMAYSKVYVKNPNAYQGQIGLLCSFINTLKTARDNNYEYLLHLESDAVPINTDSFLYDSLTKLDSYNNGWKNKPLILYLGRLIYCSKMGFPDNTWMPLSQSRTHTGAQALLVTKPAIPYILDYIQRVPFNRPLDIYLTEQLSTISLLYTGQVSKSGMCMGIFDQYLHHCGGKASEIEQEKDETQG